ncbi:MAG TPA: hypothetical protein VNO69_02495 [Methyloceanibacter sp.]|nr:hypothetical protein [Methyloceanibacter sp.]
MATGRGKRGKKKQRGTRTYAPDNPAQSRKFIEAAKKRGVDEDGKAFEQARRNLRKTKPKG